MKVYSFEKVECWQHAGKLTEWTYKAIKKFPKEEQFGMIMQMRRAVISIASNLAEGTSRKLAKDQSHFKLLNHLNF